MKSALIALAVATTSIVAVGAVSVQPTMAASSVQHVDNFQLTDHTRYAHDLYYYKYAPAVVIMTRTNGSAYSAAAAAELEKLAASYKDKGVLFFMLDSKLGEDRDAVAAEAKAQNINIPILMDEYQLVGESLGVSREGEVFVLDPKTWNVAYHGPLDDRFNANQPNTAARASNTWTAKAIDGLLAGKPVQTASIDLRAGPAVAFPQRDNAASFQNISYSRDVAPILQEKCASCHIDGGIAPFAMTSYKTIAGYAPMIRETIRTKRMPPYFADPHIGQFKHDESLTAAQAQTIVHWIEAGAKRGDGPDPLTANEGKTAPEWPVALGKPDVVIDLPAFTVPASGIIDYQNQRVLNPFKDDVYLRAMVVKPGDRRVVHHIISNYIPDRAHPSDLPGGSVGSYTPGAEPQIIADGAGAPVPGGGSMMFQMHYTSFGQSVTDHSQVGFYLLKDKPEFIKRSAVIGDFAMRIPAGDPHHVEQAYMTFPADAYIYTLYPHAHYRGRNVELRMQTPDGKEKLLISLPKYDFNWQRDYDPVEPIFVPAGTKLIATWDYDNSANNFANPDPKRDVTWGEQTFEEMMYFRVNYRFVDETTDHIRNDLQTALNSSLQFGALDDNVDDKIEPDELKGPMERLKASFAMLDRDGDGALSQEEFASMGGRRGPQQRASND